MGYDIDHRMKPLSAGPEPKRGLPRILFKLRTEGFGWLAKRVSHEVSAPSTAPGQLLHTLTRRGIATAAALPRQVRRSLHPGSAKASETLFAFYDLKVSPITFDFLWFLTAAELHRRRRGLKDIHVVVVPGPHGGVRMEEDDYDAVVDAQERRHRIRNILSSACSTLPSSSGFTVTATREEASTLRASMAQHVFPADYETALPSFVSSRHCMDAARNGEGPIGVLRATADMLERADHWIAQRAQGRPVVTITSRAYGYMPARNSNSEAWAAFARSLDPNRYLPVIIPDLEETIKGVPAAFSGLTICPEASRSVAFRMALYERVYVNMGVNTGPMGLCWLNDRTRYLTFKMASPDVPQNTLEYYSMLGFQPGHSLPFATPTQRLVWSDDTFEAIDAEFAKLVALIESEPRSGVPQNSQ